MADWFDFAGKRSTALGVYVQDFPPLTLPEERAEFKPVLGRSGSLTLLEGENVFEDIVLSLNCFVRDLSTLDQIAAWLRGSGKLVLGNRPDRYYIARAVNQIELTRLLRGREHRTFAAVFRCAPYRYVYPEPAAKTYTTSPDSITNPGTADAEPIITVVGSGNIALTIGEKTLTIEGLTSSITIDCEVGKAYNGSDNLTPTVGVAEWPFTILPGINAVSWTGTVTSVNITRPWRYI